MDGLPISFGKYFLTEKIATGGMAEIFLAKLIGPGGFEKPLIIKQIHPELGGQLHFVDLFVAEAKTLVSLSHGNIVPVYELGVIDGVYFIAMEYIDGPTLRELGQALARDGAQMQPASAAFITAEILKGLDYAHRKGVIHRDLSPRNVMLSRDGEVKLVDFGIALRAEEGQALGKLVGSYPYMSPEQVRREELTPKSDLFSAGVLLWEMLTGRDLFARDSADETLRAVTDADIVRPALLEPSVPAALDEICMRALCRERDGRHDDAASFLAALQHHLYALDALVTPVSLSQMVARRCPPEVRRPGRAATDTPAGAPDAAERTRPLERERASAGERTAVHERTRPGEEHRPRGKRRAPTVRTFATHVEFRDVLARATPILPMTALTDEEVADAAARREPSAALHAGTAEAPTRGQDAKQAAGARRAPRQIARRRAAVVGVVALVAAAGAILAARGPATSRARADSTELQARHDLHGKADADAHAAPGPVVVAPVVVAPGPVAPARTSAQEPAVVQAAPVVARRTERPPAHTPPPERGADTRTERPPVHTPPPERGADTRTERPPAHTPPPERSADMRTEPGTLKVGANPWGEVYVGGKKLGRAPNAWPVPPGTHTVEVVFPVAGQEDRRSFRVTVRSGEISSLGIVDFSGRAPGGPTP